MMRIISGKHRGRHIKTLKSSELRPTTGRIREAIFNILSHGQFAEKNILQDANILDLFCGCGSLALEALSRGGASATFIDIDRKHLDIAKKNAAHIGEDINSSFICADSTNPPPARHSCSLIFVDPPYQKDIIGKTLTKLANNNWCAPNATLILEMAKKEPYQSPANFNLLTERDYGKTSIKILSYNND